MKTCSSHTTPSETQYCYTHPQNLETLSTNSFSPDQSPNPIYSNGTTNGNQSESTLSTKLVIDAAITRAKDRIFNDKFIPWKFHPRNSDFEPPSTAPKTYITDIALLQNTSDPINVLKAPDGELDESYNLAITQDGQVSITAVTSIGILHALETLSQLFYLSSDGGVYTPSAPTYITDAPMFPHRGLNLDVSRSYYAPSDIMRTIDALAWNKFNRFHLHASDAQSWPLEIPALPELAEDGAYMRSLSYSPEVLAGIQEYGAYRGIQVIIETDMPGHASSIGLAYPDLIAAFNVQPDWDTYSAEPPTGQLKLNSSAVYKFLETLWSDLLPRVSQYSAYFHTGGDEINANVYLLDEGVRSNDSSVLQPFLQKFIDFNHEHIRAAGLTPMVWEEQLLQWDLTLGSDVVVQTWESDDALAMTVAMGHKALFGNYNYWVLSQIIKNLNSHCLRLFSTLTAAKASGSISTRTLFKNTTHSRITALQPKIGASYTPMTLCTKFHQI